MVAQIFFVVIALVIILFVISLLRSRRLREKYAALWVLVGTTVLILALAPSLLRILAHFLGFQVPSNFLFLLAILLLLGVSLHLSLEISRLEDETRVLAEHVAILDLMMNELNPSSSQTPDINPPSTGRES